MKTAISSALEVVGLVVLAAGLWMLAPWLGITMGGVGLMVVGVALDLPERQ